MFSKWHTPVVIETHLSRTEVIERLRREIIGPRALVIFDQYGIVGRIYDRDCWFEYRSFWSRGNDRRLRLCFEEGLHGTSLTGGFGPPPGSTFVVAILGCGWLALCIRFLLAWLSGQELTILPVTILLLGPALAIGMGRLSLASGRGRETELLGYLEQVLAPPAAKVPGGVVIRPRHLQPDRSGTHPKR